MSLKYRELKHRYDLDGAEQTVNHLSEALRDGHLKTEEFSIRDLAEALVPDGREWVRMLDPRSAGGVSVMEAADGVDVTAFLNITGQVIYSKIMEAYTQEAFVVSRLVDTIPTRLDGEKIPGIARISDEITEIHPGMPYPHLGFGEDYIETPSTTKRGFIVPVTKEAIFFDRTHLVLTRAAEVGEVLGLNKEKRLIDLVIGVTNNYKWKGTTYNTYQTATPWINTLATNELVDWTNVDKAEQLFADILDPSTGEPVLVRGTTVLVMPAYRHAAHRVFHAAFFVTGAAGSSTATAPFTNVLTTNGACEAFTFTFFNREEGTLVANDFSPFQSTSATTGSLCWESTVLSIRSGATHSPTSSSTSLVLGSSNVSSVNIQSSGFQNGWADVHFGGANASTVGLLSDATSITIRTMPTFTGAGIVGAQRFLGLPVTGFMIRTFSNGTLTCTSGACQGNYASLFAHSYRNLIAP